MTEKTFLPERTHSARKGPAVWHCNQAFRQRLWCLATAWSLSPMCSERHNRVYSQAGFNTDMSFRGELQGTHNQAGRSTCEAMTLELSSGYSWHISKLITVTLGLQDWIIKTDDSWKQEGEWWSSSKQMAVFPTIQGGSHRQPFGKTLSDCAKHFTCSRVLLLMAEIQMYLDRHVQWTFKRTSLFNIYKVKGWNRALSERIHCPTGISRCKTIGKG